MRHRPFAHTPDDFQLVWDLFTDVFLDEAWLSGWEYCRFEWWYYRAHALKHEEDPEFFSRNLHLWLDDQQRLAGLAISETGINDIHVVCRPEYSGLAAEVFEWIETDWAADLVQIETCIMDDNTAMQKIARLKGYRKTDPDHPKNTYDLNRMDLEAPLEPGFDFIAAADEGFDHQSRLALILNSFSKADFPLEKYYFTMQAPSYRSDLDLSITAPNGDQVAYCMGWINSRTRQGIIEPVGTHSDFRRRGLARAVIKECFKRMAAQGVRWVNIAGSSPLYDHLRPASKQASSVWQKELC